MVLGRRVDEVGRLVGLGRYFFCRRARDGFAALAGRIRAGVAAALPVGVNLGANGARRFLDGLFALLNLVDEGGLGGLLGSYGGFLDSVSRGRARRSGQVRCLQIHRLYRHCPGLLPERFSLL